MIKVEQDRKFNNCVKLSFDYCEYYVQAIKRLDKRKYLQDTHEWRILKSEVPYLGRMIGTYNLSFESDQLRQEFYGSSLQKRESEIEECQERLKHIKPVQPFNFRLPPLPHQVEAYNYGLTHNNILIADEMGLGKTMESLTIAVARKQSGQSHKCLIICGDNSTKYNWLDEIHKHTTEEAVIFDQKGKEAKKNAIEKWGYSDTYFGIINIEQLRCSDLKKTAIQAFISGKADVNQMPENEITRTMNDIADLCIADEIHKMKNANSKQGIALQCIQTKYKIGLSGTPLTNHVEDLWNIMKWLNAMPMNYWQFREKYCILGGYQNKAVVGYKNLNELATDLKKVMIRRTKETVLNLPDKIYKTEYLELSPETKKLYNEVKKGIVFKLTEDMKVKKITLSNALTQMLRLRQITDGVNSIDGSDIELLKKNPKLDRIKELLESQIVCSGNKALIFTSWETIADIYRRELKDYNPAYIVGKVSPENRQIEVNRFQNDPDCHIAIGTIGAMGTGLTMTAAEYVFFVDKYWNQTDNDQAEDRAHRIGSKNNVTIISMVCKGTIDEKIETILQSKASLFNTIVNGESAVSADESKLIHTLLQ